MQIQERSLQLEQYRRYVTATGKAVLLIAPMFVSFYLQTQVRVRFVSRSPDYVVTDAPIAVPTNLGRRGLSEVINHLLGRKDNIPFDFLINNSLLRVTLEKYITQHTLSTEDILIVEYLPAILLSDAVQSADQEAWVGSLCVTPDYVVCGCYDGSMRLCDKNDLTAAASVDAHQDPIRAVLSWTDESKGDFIVTGSKDHTAKCWFVDTSGKAPVMTNVGILKGPLNSIECLELFGSSLTLLTGDWSGNVYGFDATQCVSSAARQPTEDVSSRKKRRKDLAGNEGAASGGPAEISSKFCIHAHSQAVTGICALKDDLSGSSTANAHSMFTSSYDHSLKLWDIETQNCLTTFVGPRVVTAMHFSRRANAVATAHPDGRVRLWDSRQREAAPPVETYGNTDQWISGVSVSFISFNRNN